MTVILAKPQFKATGALRLAGDDEELIKFTGVFKRLSEKERKHLNKRMRKAWMQMQFGLLLPAALPPRLQTEYDKDDLAEVDGITDEALLDEVLLDWELLDVRDTPVPYTPETRIDVFTAYAGMEAAFVSAFLDALNEQKPVKNFKAQSSTG